MADTKFSALPAVTSPVLASEMPVIEAGTPKKITLTQIQALLGIIKKTVGSTVNNSTTTAAKITDLDVTLGAGTYTFKYSIIYQSAATTTGVKFDVNHSGTVTRIVWWSRYASTGTTASTGAASMAAAGGTGNLHESFGRRAKGTAGITPTVSVDAANSDMLMIIEGIIVISASGDLQLYHGSEVAAQSSVMAGSSLEVTQIA